MKAANRQDKRAKNRTSELQLVREGAIAEPETVRNPCVVVHYIFISWPVKNIAFYYFKIFVF